MPGTTASNIDLSKLGSILVAQKAKRGTGPGPSTDQVYAAVEKLGMTLDQRQQILANSSGANYCELAHAGELVIVVCEYGADKDASTALASINEKWAQLNSTLVRTAHKSSILTVVHGGNRVAAVDKVIAAFNTL